MAALGIILIIIAAALMALSSVLQHKATNEIKKSDGGSEAGALARTLKKPLFLFAFALMVVGYAFQVAALGLGQITVIQVIFVTQLIFILPFSMWISKTPIAARDWMAAILVTLGICFFVIFANPSSGDDNATNLQWFIAIAVISVICAVTIGVGYRTIGTARALLIGIAGGVINGLVAALTKGTIDYAMNANVLTGWILWVTLFAALLGVLFPLMAFRAGPITASFPAVMALNPIVSALLGAYLFNEELQSGILNITIMVVSSIVIFIGIIWLSRSKAIAEAFEETGNTAVDVIDAPNLR